MTATVRAARAHRHRRTAQQLRTLSIASGQWRLEAMMRTTALPMTAVPLPGACGPEPVVPWRPDSPPSHNPE